MKKTIFFLVLIFCSTLAHAQMLLERIVDSVPIKEYQEFVKSKTKADSVFLFFENEFFCPFEPEDFVIHEVYNCRGLGGCMNIVNMREGLVDTSLFTKSYFINGTFLEDWVNLKEQGKANIDNASLIRPFIFDTTTDKAYSCIAKEPKLVEIHHRSWDLDTIYRRSGYKIDERWEDRVFIGKLFKSKAIEFVFHYPTFIKKDDEDFCDGTCIFWNTGYCFGMKGNQFFYIDLDNEKIFPMEEVVENHWDWITNVKEK